MIVYVVTETWWDSHEVHGVFSTLAKAEEYVKDAIPQFGGVRENAFEITGTRVDYHTDWTK